MKSILVELTCHNCMFHTYRKTETLAISDFETQVREDLLQDTFFTMSCPRCATLIEYLHPLIYVDTIHHFIIYVKSKKDFKEEDHALYREDKKSRKRFIYDHKHIAEKIRIFEDHMDDRAIEIIKLRLKRKYQEQPLQRTIQYHDFDKQSETIWFTHQTQDEMEYIAIVYDAYKNVKKGLPKESYHRYEVINEEWALRYLANT